MNLPPNVPSPTRSRSAQAGRAGDRHRTNQINYSFLFKLGASGPEVRRCNPVCRRSIAALSCTSLGLAITPAAVSLGIATTRLPAPLFRLARLPQKFLATNARRACRQLACASSLPLLLIGLQVPLIG